MIKPIFNKEGFISDDCFSLSKKFSPENEELNWDRLNWFRGNRFFFAYDDEEFVKINFSIQDLGTRFDVVIYNTTEYTDIMSKEDLEGYFNSVILKEFNFESEKWDLACFKKTRSYRYDHSTVHYSDIFKIEYLYLNKKRMMTGKSSIISKYLDVTIDYCIWKSENSWGDYFATILGESDPEIRRMKEAFIYNFYKKMYK